MLQGTSTRVVLAGFEPFGGAVENPSWLAASQVAARRSGAVAVRLPVVFGDAWAALATRLRALDERPLVVLCVGMAAGRTAITPERVAVNERIARIPDNAGAQPTGEPILAGAPAQLRASLPVTAIAAALRRAGIPGAVSGDAGRYVCNDTFYRLQQWLDQTPDVLGGFLHVPATPEAALPEPAPTVPLETVVRAVAVAVDVCVAETTMRRSARTTPARVDAERVDAERVDA